MNRLAEIETFIAVVAAGSQLAAARHLNIAVSAINRRIHDLEERLGVELTYRTQQGTTLTHYGQTYYDRCLRVVADLNEADAMIAGEMQQSSGLIRIAVPHALGAEQIAPIMNKFAVANPEVHFEINVSDRQIDLVDEQYDLAIRIDGTEKPELEEEVLYKVRYRLCASPTFWQTHGLPKSPDDLIGLPALAYQTGKGTKLWSFRNSGGKLFKVPLTTRYVANNGGYIIEAAKAGLGMALEPEFVCGEALDTGALVPALDNYQSYTRFAKIVRANNRPPSLRVQRFVEVLRADLSQKFNDTPT
ncbi:LysR family transcriptional regulator [Ahrensia sp. R2A130]|uniref:LysR family transcriptional regulator n=1 Tax=Ahrensia sp. R2A130 TaxID=744979 RepID=UPI0001E08457|nr:LysR family transcriptional regulator [Ahrensia sp. R2A130]EFL87452.1 LysR family transcriptional regulator [Ahrensia sp. R2A130]